ncbi:MAG: hypothetical protein AAF415_02935 [Pseudomonadota bacterium]
MSSVVLSFPTRPEPVREAALPASLDRLVLRFAPRGHGTLAAMALLTAPLLYIALEIPKWIVNGALARDFGAMPALFGGFGAEGALLLLCLLQAAMLGALSTLKCIASISAANLGERFLRSLRHGLLRRWRRGSLDGGVLPPVLTQELEAIAGFAGSAIATPVSQTVSLATVMTFLIVQDWRLAIAALALTPVQAFVVPRMQRRISKLRRARIAATRAMCEKIGSRHPLGSILADVHLAQDLRFDIHRRKFTMKAAYNLIGHMTPLSYLSVGGFLVLSGDLSLGALVAALAAYREGAGPLREVFNHYLRWTDARTRYAALLDLLEPRADAEGQRRAA